MESKSEFVPKSVSDNVNKPLGPVYIKRQRQHRGNSVMVLAILFSLKSMETFENGLQPNSGTSLFGVTEQGRNMAIKVAATITDASLTLGVNGPLDCKIEVS